MARKSKERMVSLQIDAKTCIFVPESKATKEYAEEYRQRMTEERRKSDKYEPTDFKKKNNVLNADKNKKGKRKQKNTN